MDIQRGIICADRLEHATAAQGQVFVYTVYYRLHESTRPLPDRRRKGKGGAC